MIEPLPSAPLPPVSAASPPSRLPMILGASVFACAAAVLGLRHHRSEPPQLGQAGLPSLPGMMVGGDAVKVADDASQWSVLKIEPAALAGSRWSDPVPAHVVFDDRRASRQGSPLAGRVTRVDVERGQHVKRGEPLFSVASASLAELRAGLQKAIVERTAARTNLERIQALVDGKALPGKELTSASVQLTEAELAVQLAEHKLGSLDVTATDDASFTVVAQRDGVVVEQTIAAGQQVDATTGTAIAIADLSSVWVVADLFEADGGALRAGARAKVIVGSSAETDAGLDGVVDQVSAVVDPDRHTVPVRVTLANPDGALRPNAHVQLRFVDPLPAVVELPAEAVLSDGATSYIYVKDGGSLKRRTVTAGPMHQGKATVIAGVAPGELVVTRGAILLDNQLDH